MIYRSKAPLRIGFAGGGTDVSPYSDLYGGAVLNATVSLYARAAIEPIAEPKITLQAWDQQILCEYDLAEELPADGRLELLKAVYNHFSKNYGIKQGFRLYTSVDAPPGSGLGSSSTLAVALTGAFAAWPRSPARWFLVDSGSGADRSLCRMARSAVGQLRNCPLGLPYRTTGDGNGRRKAGSVCRNIRRVQLHGVFPR